jgi:hypothetical protein
VRNGGKQLFDGESNRKQVFSIRLNHYNLGSTGCPGPRLKRAMLSA